MNILIKKAIRLNFFDGSTPIYNEVYTVENLVNKDENSHWNFLNQVVSNFKSSKKYTPAKGDKLYFMPGCTVPRFKVKQFCQKHNVAVVKAPTATCYQVISDESIRNLFNGIDSYVYSKQEFLDKMVRKGYANTYPDFIQAVEDSESPYVFCQYKASRFIQAAGINLENLLYQDSLTVDYYFDCVEDYNKYLSMLSNPNIIDQNEIISKINDGASMTEEQYYSIKRLFDSTNTDDHKVACEIMANCDYEKSCVYLLLLFKEFGDKIYNNPNRRHVNFKTLLNFFEINSISRVDLNDIIESLISRRLLNKSNLDRLMPIIFEEIKDSHTLSYFEVKDIDYDTRIAKALESNILDGDINTDIVSEDEEELNPKF